MTDFDFVTAFYEGNHKPETIVREIDKVLASKQAVARAIPFGCELGSVVWLDGRNDGNRQTRLVYRKRTLSCFQLDYSFKEQGRTKKSSGRFFIIQDDEYSNVFVALTIESTQFFNRALLPLLNSQYPKAMMTFITHRKLQRLLEEFQTEGGYNDLVITRASQRLRYEEKAHVQHIMPVVSWPSIKLSEAFEWVREQNGWFESISFDVRKHQISLANLTFSRKGVLRADALFENAYQLLIKPTCKTIHDNLELFSHRARLEREDLSTRPLAIEFEKQQFRDLTENQRFIQAMKRLKSASVSVVHGNPYIHLSVIDYFDGSVFDVWVLDEQQVVIVPQLKGTVASIKRLINHVFDDYAEGHLHNYSQQTA
jgi:hypothetical protein